MADETKDNAPKTSNKDLSKFDSLAREYCSAPSPEARAKVIAENPDLMKQGILARRRLEREALPFFTALLHRGEETTVGSIGIGAAILGGLGFAGLYTYKGVMAAWHWFRPV